MGTSTSYSAPPSWSSLKTEVTKAASGGALSSDKAGQLLKNFVDNNGGARGMARATGGGGRGGAVGSGRAARKIASRLAGFISEVGRVGLQQALSDAGWGDLINRPVGEVLAALLDRLGGEASTIEDVDARMALSRLQDKYLAEAETTEELEALLARQVDNVDNLLQDFFGLYLDELFSRVFFERLVQRVGDSRANSFLEEISDFIASTLANRTADRGITSINWAGADGQAMLTEIMETTLAVFGGVE